MKLQLVDSELEKSITENWKLLLDFGNSFDFFKVRDKRENCNCCYTCTYYNLHFIHHTNLFFPVKRDFYLPSGNISITSLGYSRCMESSNISGLVKKSKQHYEGIRLPKLVDSEDAQKKLQALKDLWNKFIEISKTYYAFFNPHPQNFFSYETIKAQAKKDLRDLSENYKPFFKH
ncbi:hypothetical protein HYV79_03845 [Candidatus Woesearchaeota archaeon]|nr:hypothetical protein [Candidatus Woesearchaeota archaeon]